VLALAPGGRNASAVAVGGGRVLDIGPSASLRRLAGSHTERVDCRGAAVLPGLIDPHLHLLALAGRSAHLDCSRFRSVRALLAALRTHAASLPAGGWLRGEGLDEARLGRLPTAAELDAAVSDHPVRLRHRSRHASVLSGLGLARLGPHPTPAFGPRSRLSGGRARSRLCSALLDTAMGCAISTMLPVGQGAVTLDLKLTYLRPLSVRSGTISAEGNVIKLGRQTSYAEGFVRDGTGNLAVHATATFSMMGEVPRAK